MRYSVVNDPVILILDMAGRVREVSLRELITEAHKIRCITSDNIAESYSLLRLVSAFVMDMLDMKTLEERRAIYERGYFEADIFDKYVKECEKKGDVFNLFDEKYPFMQETFDDDKKKLIPVSTMVIEASSGSRSSFHHQRGGVIGYAVEEELELSPSQAFRKMIAKQCFSAYSLEGPKSINGKPPLYLYIDGSNLFNTIMYHTFSKEEISPIEYGNGKVPWRNGRNAIFDKENPPKEASLLEALTWRPRKIELDVFPDGVVRKILKTKGLNFEGEWHDTNTVVRVKSNGKKEQLVPVVVHSVDYRVLNGLLAILDDKTQPKAIRCTGELIKRRTPDSVSIRIIGIAFDVKYSPMYGWIDKEIEMPAMILTDDVTRHVLYEDIKLIREISTLVYKQNLPENIKKQYELQFEQNVIEHLLPACMDSIIRDEEEEHKKFMAGLAEEEASDAINFVKQVSDSSYRTKAYMEYIEKSITTKSREIIKMMQQGEKTKSEDSKGKK